MADSCIALGVGFRRYKATSANLIGNDTMELLELDVAPTHDHAL
jgi:hypothetical protein